MISKGVRYMLLATFFFALMNVFVKTIKHIPAVEIVFFRSLVSFVLSFVVLRAQKVNVFGNNKKLLLARGGAGAVALILYFITLQRIPLASALTIQFLSPIFTTILGIYIVKEKVKPLQWLFFGLAFLGILFIQGFDQRITYGFLLIGIISSVFSGLAYNVIRKLNTSEHPLVIVFYFPLVTLPLTGIYCLFDWEQPSLLDLGILILIGTLTQFAQYFMTKSYQSEEISKIASLKYIGIIYALSFGYVFFGETFNLMTYFGMVVVLVGVFLNVWYKQSLSKKATPKAA
ncbi:MAG: DMT family transporter [Bacteroidota bacterium]